MTPEGDAASSSAPAATETQEPSSGLGTWEWDARSGKLWWSDEIYRIFGVDRARFDPDLAKLVAMTLAEDRPVHDIDAASHPPSAYSIYFRIRRPDGIIRTLRETGGASPRWSTAAPLVIGTIMDVTDATAGDTTRVARVGCWNWDSETGEIRASPEALQILGLSHDGIVCDSELCLVVHPEDRERVDHVYVQAKRDHGAFSLRYRILRPNGEIRYVEEDARPTGPGSFESRIVDVTDSTRLERNLIRAQNIARLGTWEFDPRTSVLWWSDQTYRLLGLEPRSVEPSMRLWFSRIHSDDLPAVRHTLEQCVSRQQPYSVQYRVEMPDGSTRILLDQAEFSDGLEVGLVMDITERLRVERTLSRAQAIGGFGSWEWNRRTGQVWRSDAFCRILGIDPPDEKPCNEQLGLEHWLEFVHAEDRDRLKRIRQNAFETDTGYSAQYRVLHRSGSQRVVLEQAECDVDGVYTGVLVDVTEHYRAERNLNLAQQIAQIGSWEWSLTSPDHWCSAQCYRIFALDPKDGALDEAVWSAMTHAEDRVKTQADRDAAIAVGGPYTVRYRLIRPDGEERIVLESGESISDDRYVGTLVDITERVRVEQNLADAQRIAGLGSWDIDDRNREIHWSDEMYRLVGVATGSVAPGVDFWMRHVHDEDRAAVRDTYARANRDRVPYTIQYRVIRTDGQVRTMLEQCEYADGRVSGYVLDITERQSTQRRLAKAQEIARIGSWEWDPSNDQTWISDEVYRMLGLDPKQWAYSWAAWFDLIHPDDRERVRLAYQEADMSGGGTAIEFQMRQPDGSYRTYYEQSEPNESGTYAGILWDVTDLTRAQRNMNHAQRIARIGSWEWDLSLDEHWWSEECYRILGFDPEVVKPSASAWHSLMHPDDVAWTAVEFEQACADRRPYTYQYRIVRPDGQVRTVFETGEPVSAGKFAGTVMDVTERVKIETRLAESQRIAKLGSWEWNLETDERWWSDECYRIYDVSPSIRPATRQTWLNAVHPDDLPSLQGLIASVEANPRPYSYRCRIRRSDGSIRTVQVHGEPIADFGPGNRIVTGTTLDITDRESIEAQLRHAQKMEAVGQLTGGIAHDFNNLLGAILGNLDLLLDEIEDRPPACLHAGRAVAAAESGAQLIRRLLAFSRKQTLNAQPTDLNELVVNILDLLRRTLGDKVQIETSLAPGRIVSMIDRSQTEGALLNLCINARDAMPDGGTVTIRTRAVRFDALRSPGSPDLPPGRYVELSVADTGTGMSRDIIDRVFEPFFTTKAPGQGSGLGLSMVYGFVRQSDGHIEIDSEPGQGTRVLIYLPIHAGELRAAESIPVDVPAPRGGKELILVVEDNPDLRGYVVSALRACGYRALSAPGAKAALRLIETRPDIALLFTDIVFKEGPSGLQLMDVVRRRRPDLPVLLTSGYLGDQAVRDRLRRPGTFAIDKPFRAPDLGRKLAEIFAPDTPRPTLH
ncbi:MAG TPA: PAS domain-containing protein [Candidatus Cybelea sp.]|nr:PAS domain-containing protein [Candidatus Cybelea sp.]